MTSEDMLGRQEAISVLEGLKLILGGIQPGLKEEGIRLELAGGRVLSRDVISPEDLPGFMRSTMDGYAVMAEDTFGLPCYLNLAGEIAMAEAPDFKIQRGEAAGIPTGGMLPEGADAVVMLEHAETLGRGMIEVQKPVSPGENVIRKGEDFSKGEPVLAKGHRLRPQDIAALAGLGIAHVHVYERPDVSIISTGDEIVSHESPLRPGLVRDMNSFILSGLVEAEGGRASVKGILRDDPHMIMDAVSISLRDSHMLLITGGSSVGAKDMTAGIIKDMGRLLFHGVAMKPGKPTAFGLINGKPVFGLPGHPAAVMLCFQTFIRPALRVLSGLADSGIFELAGTVKARLTKGIRSSAGRTEFIRVTLTNVNGELYATPELGKSGLIRTLLRAHGTVCLLPHQLGVSEGETVEVRLF